MTTITYKTLKAFQTAVRATVKAEGRMRDKYQSYGVFAMGHYQTTGDSSYMAMLVNEMRHSHYRKDMLTWVKTFAPVKSAQDTAQGDNAVKFKTLKTKDWATDTDLEGATNQNFWEINGDKGFITFDLFKEIEKVLDKQHKVAEGENERANGYVEVPPEAEKMLRQVLKLKTGSIVKLRGDEAAKMLAEGDEKITITPQETALIQ